MGNVFAAGPSPQAVTPPPLTAIPPQTEKPATDSTETKQDVGPGSFEDLHKVCKEIFPQIFEGSKLIVSKGLSSHFQISHTISMGTFQPSGYKFGATYVGTRQFGPQEAFPVLVGDIDANGDLNANMIHAFTERLRGKCVVQIQSSKLAASQISADYRGNDFTSSITLGNIDIINESGVVVSQYLQRIRPNLDLGAELLYQYGSQIPGGEITVFSLAGKLTGNNWQASANVSPAAGGLHVCYYHKINEQLQVGAELETTLNMQESVATVGYQLEIPNAAVTFKGQLDTNWCIGATLEKKLQPFPFTFALSGYANHVKSQYRFGVGLIVG